MADNVTIPAQGTGDTTPVVAADDVGGVKYQRFKLSIGADGVANDLDNAHPVPVSDAGGSLTVDGTLTVNVGLTDTQLRATPVPVSGTVTITPSGTQTVSGTVTANVGTTNGLALDATLTGGTQKSKLVDTGGTNVASVSGAGALKVDGSAVTQPVSGTVTTTPPSNASTNVAQVAGTATDVNSGVKSAGTQRVVLATDQPQLTNALKVDGSAVTQPVSGTVTTTPPSNASTNIAQVAGATVAQGHGTAASALRVELPTDGTGTVVLATGAATIGALTANQSVNQTQVAGTTVDTNSGNKSAGTQRFVLATDQPALTNALKVDGSAVTQPISGTITATGTISTELSTGLTTFSNTALSNTKTAVKASAGKVYGWMVHNPSAATAYIQVWNVAIGSITVGTTAPTYTIPLPAGASANVMSERGITHGTEINIAATTTPTGSTAPATALVVSIFYI